MTIENSRADALTDAVWRLKRDLERGDMGAGTCLVYMADLRTLLAASPVEQPAAAPKLTEKQRHAVDEAAKVLRDNWEHGTAEDLLMAFLPESSDPQPAPSPADERAAMQDAFERSEFYFNGESPVERADNWKIWVAAWKAARRPVRTFVKYIITGVAELYRAQGMNNIAGEILSLIDTERAASANETGAEGADALAHEVWSAAQRAAFDSEVGSVIADAATRGIAWMSFKAGIAYARRTTPDRDAIIEQCAKVCEDYAADQWRLYKGRAPYTGDELGRADPEVQGRSNGGDVCATRIRELKTAPTSDKGGA